MISTTTSSSRTSERLRALPTRNLLIRGSIDSPLPFLLTASLSPARFREGRPVSGLDLPRTSRDDLGDVLWEARGRVSFAERKSIGAAIGASKTQQSECSLGSLRSFCLSSRLQARRIPRSILSLLFPTHLHPDELFASGRRKRETEGHGTRRCLDASQARFDAKSTCSLRRTHCLPLTVLEARPDAILASA